jgi:Zn-dependent peptidase ImmA (M78 family)
MPAEAVHATVRQVGVRYDGWTWEMLLRLKHRFGVSAETFLYRLGELDLIAPTQLAACKKRILTHYAATHHAEPDGSLRLLAQNGRLGDLLLESQTRAGGDQEEVRSVMALLKRRKVLG